MDTKLSNKAEKIKILKIIMDEMTAAIAQAIEVGADRDEATGQELPIFYLIDRGSKLLEEQLKTMYNMEDLKSRTKLDN